MERFIAMYQLLDQKAEDYDHVISTDVKDVIFQNNPFEYLEDIYDDYTGEYIKICASSENIIYKNEDWGNNNLKVSYPHLYERFKNSEIFNAGVIGGETYFIKDLFLNIYHLSLIGGDRQPDQAAYNILIHSSPYDDIVHSTDIWCAQLGTSLADNIIEKYKDRTIDEHPPKIQDNGDVVFIQEVFSTNPTVFRATHGNSNRKITLTARLFFHPEVAPLQHMEDNLSSAREGFEAVFDLCFTQVFMNALTGKLELATFATMIDAALDSTIAPVAPQPLDSVPVEMTIS